MRKSQNYRVDIQLILLLISAILTGLIWTIQRVHYPSMRWIADDLWVTAHEAHVRHITPVVAPLMVAELAGAIYWAIDGHHIMSYLHAVMVLILWLSTFLIQVPIHERLKTQKDLSLIDSLVQTNWIRTLVWSVKTIVLLIGYTTI